MRAVRVLSHESVETKKRRMAAQRKQARVARARASMTAHERDEEEARLIFEARQMARKLGLDTSSIGDRWSDTEALELQHDGQLSAFRVTDVEAVQ